MASLSLEQVTKVPPRRLSARRKERVAGWLFLTPAVAYLLFAFFLPIVYNVMLSFEQTSPATVASFTAPFAGLDNYRFILHDPTSRAAIVHTLWFTVGSLVGQFLIGFALALLFTLRFPGRTLARSLIIVPWLLPLIVTGVIFRFLFQVEGGAVNQLLSYVGLANRPIDWLDNPHLALWTVLLANIWLGIPFFTLLLYSALQDVPAEVREAALIDGASAWQRLRFIIVPIILPVIQVTLLLGFVFTVKVFDLVIGLTGGGPANSTQLITTWSYNLSFQVFNFGEGAALNNLLLVLAMICAPVYLWLSRDSLRSSSGAGQMTRRQKSRALRWLSTLAAAAALVIVLFPVYAIIVGSFESTETLFSGTFYWLPHEATLENYRTVLHAQKGNVLTSLILGVGTALLALVVGRAGGLRAFEIPPACDGRHRQLAADRSDRSLHRSCDLAVHHLPLDPPREHVRRADPRRRYVRDPLCDPRATGVLLQPAQRAALCSQSRRCVRVADVPPHRDPTRPLGCDNRCGLRVPGRLG